jgi:hypothetical protein
VIAEADVRRLGFVGQAVEGISALMKQDAPAPEPAAANE